MGLQMVAIEIRNFIRIGKYCILNMSVRNVGAHTTKNSISRSFRPSRGVTEYDIRFM